MDNNLATKHDLKNVELALKNDIVLLKKDLDIGLRETKNATFDTQKGILILQNY